MVSLVFFLARLVLLFTRRSSIVFYLFFLEVLFFGVVVMLVPFPFEFIISLVIVVRRSCIGLCLLVSVLRDSSLFEV